MRSPNPMARPDCIGEGSGWGTVDGSRLRVLVLSDLDRSAAAHAICRALSVRHDPTLVEARGIFTGLKAARAAREVKPHLIHAVGAAGAARSAPVIASGTEIPFVLSLTLADLKARAARGAIDRAAA